MKTRTFFALGAVAAAALAGCGDDPFAFPWEPSPDTVRLFALSRPEPNLVSALDLWPRRLVRVEAAATGGQWDLAVDTAGGRFVWLPPGVMGIETRAGVAELDETSFEEASMAPADTARYATTRSLPVEAGRVYAVRTRQHQRCRYYGKIQALEMDVARAVIRVHYDLSPACNNRSLVPPG